MTASLYRDQVRILIVDDSPTIRRFVRKQLAPFNAVIDELESNRHVIAQVQGNDYDLLLLDLNQPDVNGFDLCTRLKGDPATADVPIIFLTGSDRPEDVVRGFEVGAADFVRKGNHPAELKARVRSALTARRLNRQLVLQANTDGLTGLMNRPAFIAQLERRLAAGHVVVMFLDFDRFKLINDSLGHDAGDQLLLGIASRLGDSLAEAGVPESERVVARFGGDEFVILIGGVDDESRAFAISDVLLRSLAQSHRIGAHEVTSTASIGIVIAAPGTPSSTILRDADVAMYSAKGAGKARAMLFDAAMHEAAVDRLEIEQDLHRVITAKQLELTFQPIHSLKAGGVAALDVGVRWNHPERGILESSEFIPIAEETGLVSAIDAWTLQTAIRQFASLHAEHPNLGMSIGQSGITLMSAATASELRRAVANAGVEPGRISINVEETAFSRYPELVLPAIDRLRTTGVRVALSGFGTGQTSLTNLHRLPIDFLRIDRDFVPHADASRESVAVNRAIITLAHGLEVKVIAEGADTPGHLALLQSVDCDFARGTVFAPPMTSTEVATYLASPASDAAA